MMSSTFETDRSGVSFCQCTFVEMGFIFREQLVGDYGVDAIIEPLGDNYATGKLIAVQIKSGTSYFKEENGQGIVYRGSNKHYEYWINHSLPVIIVLYNPVTKECIWEEVNKFTSKRNENGWKIEIPRTHVLKESKADLLLIANKQNEYERRWNSLVLAKPWMLATRESNQLILEVEEWINKTSGRGHFRLKNCKDEILYESDILGFGCRSYDQVIMDFFPWADISIDEEFYEIEMDREWYDQREEAELELQYSILSCGGALPKRNPKIYPYANSGGEVDFYRLLLSLNEVGKAFLAMEEFLENGSLYYLEKIHP